MNGQGGSSADGNRLFFSFLSLPVVSFRREGASFGGTGMEESAKEVPSLLILVRLQSVLGEDGASLSIRLDPQSLPRG